MNLIELRKQLPRGYAEKISQTHDFSRSLIYKVAAGERENEEVLEALTILANQNQERRKQKKQKLVENASG